MKASPQGRKPAAIDQFSYEELEQAWIAAQVSKMPTPSRHDAKVWAALLDIPGLLARERAA